MDSQKKLTVEDDALFWQVASARTLDEQETEHDEYTAEELYLVEVFRELPTSKRRALLHSLLAMGVSVPPPPPSVVVETPHIEEVVTPSEEEIKSVSTAMTITLLMVLMLMGAVFMASPSLLQEFFKWLNVLYDALIA